VKEIEGRCCGWTPSAFFAFSAVKEVLGAFSACSAVQLQFSALSAFSAGYACVSEPY
jgi:hypothetical protein